MLDLSLKRKYHDVSNIKVNDPILRDYLEMGVLFHGHKCPAMPCGIRAGLAAMKALGVERASNKELHVYVETGDNHAAGCFADGVMVATGCTLGKATIEKLHYSKNALILIDKAHKKAVRVTTNIDFLSTFPEGGKFFELRKSGVQPKDIPEDLVDLVIQKVMNAPDEDILEVEEVKDYDFKEKAHTFNREKCAICGEWTFEPGLRVYDGKKVCLSCWPYRDKK